MGEDELKGADYINQSLNELVDHPDYSPHAMRVVAAIMNMTTAQLERINLTGDDNGR